MIGLHLWDLMDQIELYACAIRGSVVGFVLFWVGIVVQGFGCM